MARALLAAGDAHADEGQAGALEFLEAAHRVAEIGVAGVDDDVVLGQQLRQRAICSSTGSPAWTMMMTGRGGRIAGDEVLDASRRARPGRRKLPGRGA